MKEVIGQTITKVSTIKEDKPVLRLDLGNRNSLLVTGIGMQVRWNDDISICPITNVYRGDKDSKTRLVFENAAGATVDVVGTELHTFLSVPMEA